MYREEGEKGVLGLTTGESNKLTTTYFPSLFLALCGGAIGKAMLTSLSLGPLVQHFDPA